MHPEHKHKHTTASRSAILECRCVRTFVAARLSTAFQIQLKIIIPDLKMAIVASNANALYASQIIFMVI